MAQSKSLQFSTLNKPIHIIGDIWLVPCIANKHQNSYSPIPKPLDQSIKSDEFSKKLIWTKEEDEALVCLVLQNKPKAWNLIASLLNSTIHKNIPVRKGRQCRERWLNFLDPSLKKEKWSFEEDELLIGLHKELGNKWSEISRRIHGRNERAVKTRWNWLKKFDFLAPIELDDTLEQSWQSGELSKNSSLDENAFEEYFIKDSGFHDLGEFEGLDLIV